MMQLRDNQELTQPSAVFRCISSTDMTRKFMFVCFFLLTSRRTHSLCIVKLQPHGGGEVFDFALQPEDHLEPWWQKIKFLITVCV